MGGQARCGELYASPLVILLSFFLRGRLECVTITCEGDGFEKWHVCGIEMVPTIGFDLTFLVSYVLFQVFSFRGRRRKEGGSRFAVVREGFW